MPLDPIVSLAVAMAETPGSYAFLLGAGVSRDAGVPTGGEVLEQALHDLHRLETQPDQPVSDDELTSWRAETGRDGWSYSDVLEQLAPLPEERRAYLARHFEGKEPGPTHELLAELAARGLARVFVTTNFDRLLEGALQARGVVPVLVTQASDLEVVPAREHASCYLLKVHGDYLQQTIRNTNRELAELDPPLAEELQEVVDRYGVIALGYGGNDPAVTRSLRRRRSRYGLYWVTPVPLGEEAKKTVEVAGGRVIERASASTFLTDLDRRVTVYEQHDSGATPVTTYDETLLLLRREDRVGLRELLLAERRALVEAIKESLRANLNRQPSEAAVDVHKALRPLMERRLACLLPLARHYPERFDEELEALGALTEPAAPVSGFTFWVELGEWPLWWMGHLLGAWCVHEQAWDSLGRLLQAKRVDRRTGRPQPLVSSITGDVGETIGAAMLPTAPGGGSYRVPAWQLLREEGPELELLRDRESSLLPASELDRCMSCFSLLHCIALGAVDEPAVAYWQFGEGSAEAFARRLKGDQRLRTRLDDALGVQDEDFLLGAAQALAKAHDMTAFGGRDVIRALLPD